MACTLRNPHYLDAHAGLPEMSPLAVQIREALVLHFISPLCSRRKSGPNILFSASAEATAVCAAS